MAIFSLNHSAIGRSTHAAGTAGAHIGYITRSGACLTVMAERMPLAVKGQRGGAARAWLDDQEAADRKNARVIDKVMLALPRELTAEQQAALVRDFAEEVTLGRASWLAAVHQDHPDNPHAHLVIRDKDPETGKRVVGLSEKGSTDRLREAWEIAANLALEKAGREERIDRRSLKDQGVDREATIHVGPQPAAMERQGKRIDSQVREVPKPRGGVREVRWPEIDGGRSRAIHNDRVRAKNAARDRARGPQGAVLASPVDLALKGHSEAAEAYRPSPYASLSLAALSTAWDDHMRVVVMSVVQRAQKLAKKIELYVHALDHRLKAHRETVPTKPKIQAFGGLERWAEKQAAWAKEEKQILDRYWRMRKRAEFVKEYTATTHGRASPSHQTAADHLADRLAIKANPDLAKHLVEAQAVTAARKPEHPYQQGRDRPDRDHGLGR